MLWKFWNLFLLKTSDNVGDNKKNALKWLNNNAEYDA